MNEQKGTHFMSDDFHLDQKTEIEKLAFILHGKENDVRYLTKLEPNEISDLRQRISGAMQGDNSDIWKRLAAVSKFMPNFINAKVAQDILGPYITANLTYHIPVKEALHISSFFPIVYMADVSEYLIPEKAEPILREFPVERMTLLTLEMIKREKFYTLGTYVDFLPKEKIDIISNQIKSEEHILKISKYVNKKERIAFVIESYSDEKILKILKVAYDLDYCEDLLEIIRYAKEEHKTRALQLLDKSEPIIKETYLRTVSKN